MTAAGWIAMIVIGLVLGWLIKAYALPKKAYPAGIAGGLIAGLVGSLIGGSLFGTWGWMLGGANVIGAIIAAVVVAYVVGLFGKQTAEQKA